VQVPPLSIAAYLSVAFTTLPRLTITYGNFAANGAENAHKSPTEKKTKKISNCSLQNLKNCTFACHTVILIKGAWSVAVCLSVCTLFVTQERKAV